MWWHENLNQESVIEFFKQCQDYSHRRIHKHVPDTRRCTFTHYRPASIYPFVPVGAVIHNTMTRTVWDAIRAISRQLYGTHFIIASRASTKRSEYPMLGALPCAVIMPMGWQNIVPHAGFLSNITWSIDIRNVGRVRPWRDPLGREPRPLDRESERDDQFRWNETDRPGNTSFYWNKDDWRAKFAGSATPYGGFYQELPSKEQVETLIILLRILNAYTPMQRNFVLGADQVSTAVRDHVLPGVKMNEVRSDVFSPRRLFDTAFFKTDTNVKKINDWTFNTEMDEFNISELLRTIGWRAEYDAGELNQLLGGQMFESTAIARNNWIKRLLDLLDYDKSDINFSIRLFALAQKKQFKTTAEAITCLERTLEQRNIAHSSNNQPFYIRSGYESCDI